jgi:hypothetical protein
MAFDESAFIIAGTAIAIAGVGLYIWDTRKDSIQTATSYGYNSLNQQLVGGSRRRRRGRNNKTKRH